jgi:CRP-like cAMP-binding protein
VYILIAGELGGKGEDRVLLATLQPITTLGEMGIFNRQRRSASVEVLKQSKGAALLSRCCVAIRRCA